MTEKHKENLARNEGNANIHINGRPVSPWKSGFPNATNSVELLKR
jgi:hypothetical protein